jgi:hypothetical protein
MIRSSVVLGLVAAIIICTHFVLNATNTCELPGTIPEPIVHPFLSLAIVIVVSIIVLCIIFSEGNHEK